MSFLPKVPRLAVAACCSLACLGACAQELQLRIDDIVAPNLRLQGIAARLSWAVPSSLDILIDQASIHGRTWRKLALHCPKARIERDVIACPQGLLQSGEKIPFSFQYWPAKRSLELVLWPAAGERWQAQMQWRKDALAASVAVENGQLARLNAWLPAREISFSQGAFDLHGTLQWPAPARARIDVAASLRNAAFSDAAGNHAGEKVGGALRVQADQDEAWRWQATADWRAGEVFWQPFYFAPGVRSLSAQGTLDARQARVEQAALTWAGIGTAQFSGAWDRAAGRLDALQVSAQGLALDGLYRSFLQPLAPAGTLRKLVLSGTGDGQLRWQQGALDAATLTIHQGGMQQTARQFGLSGIDASLAWDRAQARENRLSAAGGSLGQLPLGPFRLDATLAPDRVVVAPLRIPILDGALSVEGIAAQRVNQDWRWSLSAALQAISMQRLSQALQLPAMHGTLSAIIPQVRYARQSLQVDGALLFKVFDGTVVVKDLAASDVFGPAPQVQGNIDMRNLDLDLLTQTFAFGSMQGRLDVTVHDLEIFGWKPVRFDAKVASSAGDYPRKISQRAVQNITALGGGGGVAAIQKSFLRFFDQFGYQRIGLSCRLTQGVCEMGGIADAPTGYVIVQGGGIPALTVIGYNRKVDWDELLARLQRITQGGKPIVQ